MKRALFLTSLATTFLLVMIACNKNDNNTTLPTDPRVSLLTAKPWHKANEGLDTNFDGKVDVVSASFLQPCYADDSATFVANGVLNWSEGASKCNSNDPQTLALNWNFTTNGIFMLDHDNKIFALTDSTFTIYYEIASGTTSVWNETQFVH